MHALRTPAAKALNAAVVGQAHAADDLTAARRDAPDVEAAADKLVYERAGAAA